MKKFFKFCFKYGSLAGYILLTLILIIEASMPGDISASHSNTVGDIVNDFIKPDLDEEHKYVEPTDIEVETTKNEYSVGESFYIKATVMPENSSNKSLIYSISDELVATINNQGLIKFIAPGDVTVTVTIKDTDISASVKLKSVITTATDIEIVTNDDKNEIILGETEYISVKFYPSNTTDKNVIWTSSNELVATIDNSGKITPKSLGEVTFTVTSSNNISKSITFNVVEDTSINIKPTGIELVLNGNTINGDVQLMEQEKYHLTTIFYPSDTTNQNVKWVSSNSSIASVSNGVVTTLQNGTVTITAISYADETIYTSFTINVKSVAPSFTIKPFNDDNKLTPNTSYKIELNVDKMPTNYTIKYESLDTSLCSVNEDGTLTTLKTGNTKIKVICEYSEGTVEELIDITIKNAQDVSKIRQFYLAIRKGIGHFGAFFVLAILASMIVLFFFKRKLLMFVISSILGFVIAFITEIIQLFVPGRSGLMKDVGIDFAGYISATIIFVIIYLLVKGFRKVLTLTTGSTQEDESKDDYKTIVRRSSKHRKLK